MRVYVCGADVSSIFSAVYDAGKCGLPREQVRIEPEGCDAELFCEYIPVDADEEKVRRVVETVQSRISEMIYEEIYKAALSLEPYRADAIYRFLFEAFRYGSRVMNMLSIPAVYEIFRMNRNLGREYDHLRGFTRFSETKEGILLGRIAPENNLTVLLASFFADRLPQEDWVLYDVRRKKAAVHKCGTGWVMTQPEDDEWQQWVTQATDEETYRQLWRIFHDSIGIEQRRNGRCQMTMLPLRFRPYMTEFQH